MLASFTLQHFQKNLHNSTKMQKNVGKIVQWYSQVNLTSSECVKRYNFPTL